MKAKLSACIFLFIVTNITAQWSNDPTVNTLICNHSGDQLINGMVADGSGGAIITWWDKRDISGYQVPYAQRISSEGINMWEENGVKLYNNTLTTLEKFNVISDGAGGVFFTYAKSEDGGLPVYDLIGGHINSDGDTISYPISVKNGLSEESSDLCKSLDGGAMISYELYKPAENQYDIYVQRITPDGHMLWNKDSSITGISLVSENSYQRYPQVVEDGAGGAFVVWEDLRNAASTLWDIYIQRIDSNGLALWSPGGIPVVQMMNNQRFPRIAGTSYGVVVSWDDERSGYTRLYARGINFDGTPAWGGTEGTMISDSVLVSESTDIISFGENGNISDVAISWSQNSFHQSFIDIYAQRLDSSGNAKWQDKGLLVCNADLMQWKSKITVSDENDENKIIVVWEDERNSSTTGTDIYAQKISINGNIEWQANGIQVVSANNYQISPLVSPGANGFSIAAWTDGRIASLNGTDIYAQRLTPGGLVSVNDENSDNLNGFALFNNYPNPFNPSTNIEFIIPENSFISLKVYDILGNKVADLINKVVTAGRHKYQFDGSLLNSGLYLYQINMGNFSMTRKMLLIK